MRAVVGSAILTAVVVVGLSVLAASRTAAQDFPAWLEAVATLAAFLAAMIAVGYASQAFRLERDRDDRWEANQRSAQASLVAAWWGMGERRGYTSRGGDGGRTYRQEEGVWLRNASELPVTDVLLLIDVDAERMTPAQRYGVIPPSSEPQYAWLDSELLEAVWSSMRVPDPAGDPNRDPTSRLKITLAFTDARGKRWVRGADGSLTRYP